MVNTSNKSSQKTISTNYMYHAIFYLIIIIFSGSCASYREFQYMSQELEIPTKVFKVEYSLAWQVVIDIMKDKDLSLQDQEAGVIKTKWIPNTMELNFADSFGGKDSVKSAKYKIIINVIKGFRGAKEVSKITIFRRQMINKDFLQGWKIIPSDRILEKTLLYRIERKLLIERKLKAIEDQKSKEIEASF